MAGGWLRDGWRRADKGTLALLLFIMLLIAGLWPTIIIWPLKLLVVFFHELSHGLMAMATGGRIVQIVVVPQEGGLCITDGGWPLFVLSAGYLGSLVWGGLLLLGALRTRIQPRIVAALGVVLGVVTLLYVRPVLHFGFPFGLLVAAALLWCGLKASRAANTMLLLVIGLTSMIYVPLDVFVDVLWHSAQPSDALLLARMTHIPTTIWGLIWTALSVGGAMYFVLRASESQRFKWSVK